MAVGDITRGTPIPLANIGFLDNLGNSLAVAFGEIETAGELALNIYFSIAISPAASGGTYDFYLVESQDGTNWTDNIDPASSANVQPNIADALLLKSSPTIFTVTSRTVVKFNISISMLNRAKFIGFVLSNKSSQNIPASSSEGDSVTLKVSV